jgi:hypothetical protein
VKVAAGAARLAGLLAISLATLGVHGESRAPAPEEFRLTSAMRLVTLTERIAKLHAQAGQGILAERSRKALNEAIRDFDATLRSVAGHASTVESRDNYALLALVWQDCREWATRAPTRESARKLKPRTEEMVWVASKGVKMLQGEGRALANASAVRAEGAAALAQRIAKLYLWSRWDISDEVLARELRESEDNLRRALDFLRAAPDNPAIAGELQAADIQLRFMEDAARSLKARDTSGRHIEFIAKTGDHIQESLERLAQLYDDASRDVPAQSR